MNTKFKIEIDNYHAQIYRHDPVEEFDTHEEAVDWIVGAFFDRIDEDACLEASKAADIEENAQAWHTAHDEALARIEREIAEGGYEDGDGHHYRVIEVGKSLVERLGDPSWRSNAILVWRDGDYDSVAVKSSLAYKVDEEGGEKFTNLQSLAEVFGDGDGSEWWEEPMKEEDFRKLVDCTIFAR